MILCEETDHVALILEIFQKKMSENHRKRLNIFAAKYFQVLPHPPGDKMCMQPTKAGKIYLLQQDSPLMTEKFNNFFTWYSAVT